MARIKRTFVTLLLTAAVLCGVFCALLMIDGGNALTASADEGNAVITYREKGVYYTEYELYDRAGYLIDGLKVTYTQEKTTLWAEKINANRYRVAYSNLPYTLSIERTPLIYNVSYGDCEVESDAPSRYVFGVGIPSAAMPQAVKSGCEFLGWLHNGVSIDGISAAAHGDMVLTPQWRILDEDETYTEPISPETSQFYALTLRSGNEKITLYSAAAGVASVSNPFETVGYFTESWTLNGTAAVPTFSSDNLIYDAVLQEKRLAAMNYDIFKGGTDGETVTARGLASKGYYSGFDANTYGEAAAVNRDGFSFFGWFRDEAQQIPALNGGEGLYAVWTLNEGITTAANLLDGDSVYYGQRVVLSDRLINEHPRNGVTARAISWYKGDKTVIFHDFGVLYTVADSATVSGYDCDVRWSAVINGVELTTTARAKINLLINIKPVPLAAELTASELVYNGAIQTLPITYRVATELLDDETAATVGSAFGAEYGAAESWYGKQGEGLCVAAGSLSFTPFAEGTAWDGTVKRAGSYRLGALALNKDGLLRNGNYLWAGSESSVCEDYFEFSVQKKRVDFVYYYVTYTLGGSAPQKVITDVNVTNGTGLTEGEERWYFSVLGLCGGDYENSRAAIAAALTICSKDGAAAEPLHAGYYGVTIRLGELSTINNDYQPYYSLRRWRYDGSWNYVTEPSNAVAQSAAYISPIYLKVSSERIDGSSVYSGTPKGVRVTAEGLSAAEDVTVLDENGAVLGRITHSSPTFNVTAVNAGSYHIKLFSQNGDYTFSRGEEEGGVMVKKPQAVDFEITQKPVTVLWRGDNIDVLNGEAFCTYDGFYHTLAAGYVVSETVDDGDGKVYAADEGVLFAVKGGGLDNGSYLIDCENSENYCVTNPQIKLTIQRRAVYAVFGKSGYYVYDGAAHGVKLYFDGVLDGEAVELPENCYSLDEGGVYNPFTSLFSGVKAGEYSMRVYGVKDKSGKDNYVLYGADNATLLRAEPITAAITVRPRAVSLRFSGTDLAYNGEKQAPTAVCANLVKGDKLDFWYLDGELEGVTYVSAAAAVGEYNTIVGGIVESADSPNYTMENAVGGSTSWRIVTAAVTISWESSETIIYNGTYQGVKMHVGGLAENDAVILRCSFTGDVKFLCDGALIAYDGEAFYFKAEQGSVDAQAVGLHAGGYSLQLTSLSSLTEGDCYYLSKDSGMSVDWTVERRAISVAWSGENSYSENGVLCVPYSGAATSVAPSAVTVGLPKGAAADGIIENDRVEFSADNGVNGTVGEELTAVCTSLNPDYIVSAGATAVWKIVKRQVQLFVSGDSTFVYNGAAQGVTIKATAADIPAVYSFAISEGAAGVGSLGLTSDNSAEFTAVSAGTYTVTATPEGENPYYVTETQCFTFSITPRIVRVEWLSQSFVYDGNSHGITARAANLVGADSVEFEYRDEGNVTQNGVSYPYKRWATEKGEYAAGLKGLTDSCGGNYALNGDEAANYALWSITPLRLELSLTETDLIYNGKTQILRLNAEGLAANGSAVLQLTTEGGAIPLNGTLLSGEEGNDRYSVTVSGAAPYIDIAVIHAGAYGVELSAPDGCCVLSETDFAWTVSPKTLTLGWGGFRNHIYITGARARVNAVLFGVEEGDVCNPIYKTGEGYAYQSDQKGVFVAALNGVDNGDYVIGSFVEYEWRVDTLGNCLKSLFCR